MIKNLKLLYLLFFIIFLSFNYSKAEVAFVDVDYLFENTDLGKKIKLNLNKIKKKNDIFLKFKKDELTKTEDEIINKKM